MKRSSFIVEGLIKSYQCPQATTYSNKSGIDLCLLATNRQIYQETSEILYSRNMFYFDELSVVTPFLKDRGNRSKSLMRNLSIPYTSSQAQLEGPVELHNYLLHHESILEDVFCYLSLHMQNLVQLDLRVHRGYCFHEGLLSSEDGKMLQSPGDFPAKQRKQLATLGQGVTLTVSQSRWDDWRNDNKIRDANLFAPLRPWLRESILQIRAKDLLQHERLVCENAVEGI